MWMRSFSRLNAVQKSSYGMLITFCHCTTDQLEGQAMRRKRWQKGRSGEKCKNDVQLSISRSKNVEKTSQRWSNLFSLWGKRGEKRWKSQISSSHCTFNKPGNRPFPYFVDDIYTRAITRKDVFRPTESKMAREHSQPPRWATLLPREIDYLSE